MWREVAGLPAAEREGAQRPHVSPGLQAEDREQAEAWIAAGMGPSALLWVGTRQLFVLE